MKKAACKVPEPAVRDRTLATQTHRTKGGGGGATSTTHLSAPPPPPCLMQAFGARASGSIRLAGLVGPAFSSFEPRYRPTVKSN